MELLKGIWHAWFGSHHVLKDINLTFPSKGIVAILGPSGCGKTTLLRSLNRTAELEASFRYQGSILFKGENIYAYRDPGIIRKRTRYGFSKPHSLAFEY
ncbi:MAG TPA: ATP-binding cassette domain-containing protein [Moorella mulderi]|nr:ATP-binding cassette domain-containing protein [Moorella mulderi]